VYRGLREENPPASLIALFMQSQPSAGDGGEKGSNKRHPNNCLWGLSREARLGCAWEYRKVATKKRVNITYIQFQYTNPFFVPNSRTLGLKNCRIYLQCQPKR
jgi:hypothetical protein